jgi:hypothetical protein
MCKGWGRSTAFFLGRTKLSAERATIEAAKQRIAHLLHQCAIVSGLQLDALAWTAPSASITPLDHRVYQRAVSVHGWPEPYSILPPERLLATGARDEDARHQLREALAAIMAALRHTLEL